MGARSSGAGRLVAGSYASDTVVAVAKSPAVADTENVPVAALLEIEPPAGPIEAAFAFDAQASAGPEVVGVAVGVGVEVGVAVGVADAFALGEGDGCGDGERVGVGETLGAPGGER
jgi:hypothetical protein